MSAPDTPGPPGPRELVERHGSPLFVYDGEVLRARWQGLREALPEGVEIHYAVKANPSLGLMALLRRWGAGAEIASVGELQAALAVGFDPEKILFAGPGKTDQELREAVERGVLVHAESEDQVRRLAHLASEARRRVRAGLRVHVPWAAEEAHTIIGGGGASKFGLERATALERAAAWGADEWLRLESLHVFNASNVLDAEALVDGARRTLELAVDLRGAGLPLRRVDIGGGLGVPYGPEEGPLDIEALGRGLEGLLEEFGSAIPDLRLVVEPGRYLVAEAGILLLTVLDRKSCGGVDYLVTDGGIHHMARPALIGQPHPVRAVAAHASRARPFRVVGPLCTSLDSFGEHLLPEDIRTGALLALGNAGAYGFTEAMHAFLSHPVPAEVLLLEGRDHLLRERREASTWLSGQHLPDFLHG